MLPSYHGIAVDNHGSLRQGMPEVTPVEIRVAVAHSAKEPTEATQGRLHAAPKLRRNLQPSVGGGCQNGLWGLPIGLPEPSFYDQLGDFIGMERFVCLFQYLDSCTLWTLTLVTPPWPLEEHP